MSAPTGAVADRLLWKHSSSRDFKVKNAYNLLLKESAHPPPNLTQAKPIPF